LPAVGEIDAIGTRRGDRNQFQLRGARKFRLAQRQLVADNDGRVASSFADLIGQCLVIVDPFVREIRRAK
jgi:hypothetical protein